MNLSFYHMAMTVLAYKNPTAYTLAFGLFVKQLLLCVNAKGVDSEFNMEDILDKLSKEARLSHLMYEVTLPVTNADWVDLFKEEMLSYASEDDVERWSGDTKFLTEKVNTVIYLAVVNKYKGVELAALQQNRSHLIEIIVNNVSADDILKAFSWKSIVDKCMLTMVSK